MTIQILVILLFSLNASCRLSVPPIYLNSAEVQVQNSSLPAQAALSAYAISPSLKPRQYHRDVPTNCCPTNGICCVDTQTGVVTGCCNDGQVCDTSSTDSNSLICQFASDDSSCANQGLVRCQGSNICCPQGSECQSADDDDDSLQCPVPSPSHSFDNPTSTSIPNPDFSDLLTLVDCQPCGGSRCTFSEEDVLSSIEFDLIVGNVVTNCNGAANTSIQSEITGSISLTDTWSITENLGIAFVQLLILGVVSSWSHSKTTTFSQSITITVDPGFQGVLVAKVQYKRTSGTIQIDGGDGFPLISNQPVTVESYGASIIPCEQSFAANVSSPIDCSSSPAGVVAPVLAVFVGVSLSLLTLWV